MASLVAGAAAFVCGIGWSSYHQATIDPLVRAVQDLHPPHEARGAQPAASAAAMLERLATKHPEIRDIPLSWRAEVYMQQSSLRVSSGAFWRTVQTMSLLLVGLVESVWRAISSGHFYPAPSAMNCAGCPFTAPCQEWSR